MSKPYIDTIMKTQADLDAEAERERALELLKAQTVKTGGAE